MTDSFGKFIKTRMVLSKTSDQFHAATYNGEVYVFASGYPMRLNTFYFIMGRVLSPVGFFGAKAKWAQVNNEIRRLSSLANSMRSSDFNADNVALEIRKVHGPESEGFSLDSFNAKLEELDYQIHSSG